MAKAICSVDGCENRHYGRGYCSKHYQRWRRWADPLAIATPRPKRKCNVPDCDRDHYVHGMCRRHYSSLSRKAERENPSRFCDEAGCERPHNAKGMCTTHYKAWLAAQRTCKVEGCERSAPRQGFCRGHWDRWKRYGDPLAGPPIRQRAPNGAPRAVTTSGGYVLVWGPRHPNAQANGYVLEHVKVVADSLGRALLPGENVHHLNGFKGDNRLENLELWVTMQPTGQRPADLVRWAREVLARYDSAAQD